MSSPTIQQALQIRPTFVADPFQIGLGLDKGWIMTCAGFVFFMIIGLGLMEIGSIRRKNSRIVWYKILLNLILTIWWWFILGFAWAFGDTNGSFLGAETYYAGNFDGPFDQAINGNVPVFNGVGPGYSAQFAHYVWRVALAVVATTIATGIITERVTMKAVVLFNLAFNMITLPFVFAWTYAFGFLVDDIGYRDHAGCFIIFGNGAFAGLAGLLLIRERYNRYNKYPVVLLTGPGVGSAMPAPPLAGDRPGYSSEGQRNLPSVAFDKITQPTAGAYAPTASTGAIGSSTAFSVENVVRVRARLNEDVYEHFGVTDYGLVCLGAILFFIGGLFFNAGASQGLQIFILYEYAERSFAVAAVGAMAGGMFTALFLCIFVRRRPIRENYASIARGFVAGLVCICADSGVYRVWEGVVVGIFGALAYLIMAYFFFRVRLDDPAEFFPMFGAPAIAGIICAAFWNPVNGIFFANGPEGEVLIWQLLSLAILIGWTFFIALITFWLLRVFKSLRVGLKSEIVGYDYIDGARHLDYPDKGIETLEKERVK